MSRLNVVLRDRQKSGDADAAIVGGDQEWCGVVAATASVAAITLWLSSSVLVVR